MPRGKFIVFEGLDGSGKTTQLESVARRFREAQDALIEVRPAAVRVPLVLEREPDDGIIGSMCRGAVTGRYAFDVESQALANAAARSEHIAKALLPTLASGSHIICDRYYYSNIAYNATENVTADEIAAYNRYNAARLRPDLTVYFQISPETAAERITKRGGDAELYETLGRQRAVAENYGRAFGLLAADGELFTVDATLAVDELTDAIWARMRDTVFVSDADFIG